MKTCKRTPSWSKMRTPFLSDMTLLLSNQFPAFLRHRNALILNDGNVTLHRRLEELKQEHYDASETSETDYSTTQRHTPK
jgi:hypothetical protein